MLEANLAQMIVLVWEHVILQQEPAHAMLDAMGMIALLFVQMTALVWEHVLSQVTQYPFWYARIFSLSNYIHILNHAAVFCLRFC